MTLKVIGAGFGRTGTMSMKDALEQLGFAPCYHMIETYRHSGHVEAWTEKINGADVDLDALLTSFSATVDWPVCTYWKELKAANPDAKILLTRRDPDAWYESIANTIFLALRTPSDDQRLHAWRAETRKLIFTQTFGDRLDHDSVVAVLRAHEADVIASTRPEDLLVYDVGSGWEPLCAFFDRPIPDTPFPRSNSTAEFRQWTGLDSA
jgi:hypothetical protein